MEKQLRARAGVQTALDGGWLPLDILLAKMRNQPLPDGSSVDEGQFAAAIAAAPYIHPRLASTDTTLKSDNVHRVVSDKPLTVAEWQAEYAPNAAHANDVVDATDVEESDHKANGTTGS